VMVWSPAWISMVRQRRAVRTNFLIDQPVWASIQRLTARAANTTVRVAVASSQGRAPGRFTPATAAGDRPERMLCPILGAAWKRRFAVRCVQKRSDDVNIAVSTRLTCRNVPDGACCCLYSQFGTKGTEEA